jgi:UDP-N-acetylglucosamine/UDP-N-acetylgalactosamine diphosphorylase
MNDLLNKQRETLRQTKEREVWQPLSTYTKAGNERARQHGQTLIQNGKVGCLILAGGQGSRLKTDQPKGLIPLTPKTGKCLLQLFCEKAQRAGPSLPMAIMTSPLNHDPIADFFKKNAFFGLPIDLFSQEMLPFLDDTGNWLFEASGKVATGPDGNGTCLKHFVASGLWEKWRAQGVEYISVLPVDNPLADPFDPELIGYHALNNHEVSIKAILRQDPNEQVGVIGLRKGKIGIAEYSELPVNNTEFSLANINLFCLSLAFVKKVAKVELPWHLARKTLKGFEGVHFWKFETFLFDLFEHADRTGVIVYPRENVYAPLKNAEGDKSLKAVQETLLAQQGEEYL